ncbi:efflux RND transporter periplasmic adaptor subunit (plasmid) [Pseudoalteromonas sp. T1lg65]|uniref:efflux RND transporter periplasmic adaptor subunit n=1 Tax=Pseudoalteromonas sp. T1lg65 TaxID=2077101 RepID=UPI003F79647B
MNKHTTTIIIALIMLMLGVTLGSQFSQPSSGSGEQASGEKQPLYWVAPMDPNYRRDKPGKSPMGMDLVPVYEEASSTEQYGEGAVEIAPHVVNNLGVKTAKASVTVMEHEITTVGYVQYNEDSLVHIHPRVAGWIEQLFVKAEGDPVQQGEPLYTLYSPQLVNAQEEFLIALKRNNQALIDAAKERLRALQLSNAFIKTLERTTKVSQSITFYARQSGVVDGLKIREGFYVQPGTTLMSIAKLDEIWVEADVFERDAMQVQAGQAVTMTLDFIPARQWQGKVDYIYPSLSEKTRTLRVRLRFSNHDGTLKPNMFANVMIHANQRENVLQVPKQAVIRGADQDRVVVELEPGVFKSVAVTLGHVGKDSIEIIDGLLADDVVVTSAHFLIDSQSSINSDFLRMQPSQSEDSLWMEGKIHHLDSEKRIANIEHGPVEEWQWPSMVMDFEVAQTVDFEQLATGQSLHFEVTKYSDGSYLLTGIHIMEAASQTESNVASATVDGVINRIDLERRVLNISREAIEKWQRPPATMDFMVDESVALEQLSVKMAVSFTFEVRDEFIIVEIQPKAEHSAHPH